MPEIVPLLFLLLQAKLAFLGLQGHGLQLVPLPLSSGSINPLD